MSEYNLVMNDLPLTYKLKYAELHSQIKKLKKISRKRYFHEIFFDILILLNKETITKEQ